MKSFVDGNQLCITRDNFIDLQTSPATFYPLSSEVAKIVLRDGLLALPIGDLQDILIDFRIQGRVLEVHARQNPGRKTDEHFEN